MKNIGATTSVTLTHSKWEQQTGEIPETDFTRFNTICEMKFRTILLSLAVTGTTTAMAQEAAGENEEEYVAVPERAIVLSGGQNGIHRSVMHVLYDSEVTFNDPNAPRFLLIDRKGNTLLGIGGYVEGIMQYDFNGALDSYGMSCFNIAVPGDPKLKSRFGADASHTTIVLNLLHKTRLGVLSAYVQGNFSGANYGFKLKQAYLRLNHVTFGLTRSTFQDALATPATIDYTGPCGMIDKKNFLLQYKINTRSGWGFAVSAEMPSASYTPLEGKSEEINQRVPDIPAYVQYQWAGGKSHLRASAMLRNLSYRDLVAADNRFATGYGVQFSGGVQCCDPFQVIFQASYGKGIASYQESLEGEGLDLLPSATEGKLTAPRSFGFSGGVRIDPCSKVFLTASYSQMRLYDQEQLGSDAFRRSNYAVVNVFYNPLEELQVGMEYLHGRRTDMSGLSGHVNRLQCMVKYSF